MRKRTPGEQLEREAVDAVAAALDAVGLAVSSSEPDLAVEVPGRGRLVFEVKATAVPSAGVVRRVAEQQKGGSLAILVADQIPAALRDDLNEAGVSWLDRRGHLRLVGEGLFVDTLVPANSRHSTTSAVDRAPITGRSGLAAAAALLLRPEDPSRVSEIARVAGLNPSSITRALASLESAHLADRRGRGSYRPLVPELFWALADVWPRERTTIRLAVDPAPAPDGLGHPHSDPGDGRWVAGGVRGALAWGAPLVATRDYPVDLYLPDDQTIRRLVVQHRGGEGSEVKLAPDPNGFVTKDGRQVPALAWPVAHPLFCALDLTASSRDREALEQWTPPSEFTRVW